MPPLKRQPGATEGFKVNNEPTRESVVSDDTASEDVVSVGDDIKSDPAVADVDSIGAVDDTEDVGIAGGVVETEISEV